jgi:hypothetical protein
MEDVKQTVSKWRDSTAAKSGGLVKSTAEDRDAMTAKGAVDSSDSLWDRAAEDCNEYVILTNSNGAGITEDTVKCHKPKENRQNPRVRVFTTYTLFEQ